MSKYDDIQTAADLVRNVRFHGLSTAVEDLSRASDIIGHTDIQELARLANDIGRNNRDGVPDPKGMTSSGRLPTRDTFYFIISHIWHWEEVTRFWNQFTNPEHEELVNLRETYKQVCERNDKLTQRREKLLKDSELAVKAISDLNEELRDARSRAEAAEAEVIRLKARLYDMMQE